MGILRSDIFSNLNNISENSLLHKTYESYFGFTETEVCHLFQKQGITYDHNTLKYWYDGYRIGHTVLYNPWSIMNCIRNQQLGSYWLDSGNDQQVYAMLDRSGANVKETICELIQGKSVIVPFEKYITFNDFNAGEEGALWGVLFNGGYLTLDSITKAYYTADEMCIRIPNNEVKRLFMKYSAQWLQNAELSQQYNQFIDHLITGDRSQFEVRLERFLMASFSFFDTDGDISEKVYHAFKLSLVADLHNSYVINSNWERGTGRYQILLIPKCKRALGIVMEFQSIDHKSGECVINDKVKTVLEQMTAHPYGTELDQNEISSRRFISILFCGKRVLVKSVINLDPSFDGVQQHC